MESPLFMESNLKIFSMLAEMLETTYGLTDICWIYSHDESLMSRVNRSLVAGLHELDLEPKKLNDESWVYWLFNNL